MPKQCISGLTKTDRGYCRTIGYYVDEGKRVPRKFRLGHDRMQAKRKVEVLEDAWENLPGERGQKVWTEEAIKHIIAAIGGIRVIWRAGLGKFKIKAHGGRGETAGGENAGSVAGGDGTGAAEIAID